MTPGPKLTSSVYYVHPVQTEIDQLRPLQLRSFLMIASYSWMPPHYRASWSSRWREVS